MTTDDDTWTKIDLPDSEVSMIFRRIPAGEFRMGQRGGDSDEEPVHRVAIAQDFWLGETPVTQEQFAVWRPDHQSHCAGRPHHPADSVTWNEAAEFCEWLQTTCEEQLPPGMKTARLPSEAKWEYACRAETETEYWSGDGEAALAAVGWYDEDFDAGSTHAVKEKAGNGWGLYDLHGNVWEWCSDVWDARAYRKRVDGWEAREWKSEDADEDAEYWSDEDRKAEGPLRVVRGGSWCHSAWDCRSAIRFRRRPSARDWFLGFRVCLARSLPANQSRTAKAEPAPVGGAGRQAAHEPDGAGGAGERELDLSRERLPEKPRS